MPRRRVVDRRDVLPDPVYNSPLVTKFINGLMWDGKKSTAEGIFYNALAQVGEKTGLDAVPLARASRLIAKVDSAAVQDRNVIEEQAGLDVEGADPREDGEREEEHPDGETAEEPETEAASCAVPSTPATGAGVLVATAEATTVAATATVISARISSCCRHSRRSSRIPQRMTARRAGTPPFDALCAGRSVPTVALIGFAPG